MRLGTRITITTTLLVLIALGVHGVTLVRTRRAELASDLERQTQSLGSALQVAMEAASSAGRRMRAAEEMERQSEVVGSALPTLLHEAIAAEDLQHLVARVRAREQFIRVLYLDLASGGAPTFVEPAGSEVPRDPSRDGRIRRVRITGESYGEHQIVDGVPIYAYTVPLHDEQQNVVAALELIRDESEAAQTLGETERSVAVTVLLVGLGLALLVWLTTRRGITHPIERLVVGIDEVSRGDLTRAILRERDDEIGDLAERFNQMTSSLREARSETQRGLEAKLSLEARLRHSEKLATIGQLAAGIAHEVGTPLNVIGGRARNLERKASEPAEVAKNASIIAAQAARITKIIQQLLDYARKKVAERGPIDLGRVVADSVDFIEHQLESSRVTARVSPFHRESDDLPSVPMVEGDADQLQQVCLNLCLNAIQAMPQGGTIDIATRALSRRKRGLDLAPPSRYVVLEVADSGVGIPPEDRERIFEPFYSTKQDDGGTGLGLAVSQGIVKDHDGWIEIDGRTTGGTVFRVFLPAYDPDATNKTKPVQNDSGPFSAQETTEKLEQNG